MEAQLLQFNGFPAINDKIGRLDKKVEGRGSEHSTSTPLLFLNRLGRSYDSFEEHSPIKGSLLAGVVAANAAEDWRDIKAAIKQFKGQKLPYDYKAYQAPFSTFRGTLFEKIVNKLGKLGAWLHKKDITMLDTAVGNKITNIFEGSIDDVVDTGRKVPQVTFNKLTGKTVIENVPVKAYKIGGKTAGKFVGRTLSRMPVVGAGIIAATELPDIYKEIKESKGIADKIINGSAQVLKSGINVACIWAGGAMGGAALTLAGLGPFGSLTGLGIGSAIGAKFAGKIGHKIDELSEEVKAFFT